MILILAIVITLMVAPIAFVLLLCVVGIAANAFTTPYAKPTLKPSPRFVGKNKDIDLSKYR